MISVNLGNSLLCFCFYMDSRLLFKLINVTNKKIILAETTILCLSLILFNTVEFMFKSPSLRIFTASIYIFSLYLIPTVLLLVTKVTSAFKRSISIFYIFLLLALIPRMIESFFNPFINLYTSNYYQTLLHISLSLMMVSNTIICLLFVKEQSDQMMKQMATRDYLTNVLNRHSFFEEGKRLFEEFKSSQTSAAILFFDIDYFKKINDNYGHIFGDEVLQTVAGIINKSINPSDLCCRYGGEEFIVLMNNTSKYPSHIIAARIIKKIEMLTFSTHPDCRVTISVGSAFGIPAKDEELENYIKKADIALYDAKKAGRNKLVEYEITS